MEKKFAQTLKEYVKNDLGSKLLDFADCYHLFNDSSKLSPDKRLYDVSCYVFKRSADLVEYRTRVFQIYLVRPVGSSVLFAFRHYSSVYDFCFQYVNRHKEEFWLARQKSNVNKLSTLIYSIYTYGY